MTIVAGNVVTGEMVEELILSGADVVKVYINVHDTFILCTCVCVFLCGDVVWWGEMIVEQQFGCRQGRSAHMRCGGAWGMIWIDRPPLDAAVVV